MKDYEFRAYGGQEIVDGKSEWPSLLRLCVNRSEAAFIVETLARQIRNATTDAQVLEIPIVGKLTELEEE